MNKFLLLATLLTSSLLASSVQAQTTTIRNPYEDPNYIPDSCANEVHYYKKRCEARLERVDREARQRAYGSGGGYGNNAPNINIYNNNNNGGYQQPQQQPVIVPEYQRDTRRRAGRNEIIVYNESGRPVYFRTPALGKQKLGAGQKVIIRNHLDPRDQYIEFFTSEMGYWEKSTTYWGDTYELYLDGISSIDIRDI